MYASDDTMMLIMIMILIIKVSMAFLPKMFERRLYMNLIIRYYVIV